MYLQIFIILVCYLIGSIPFGVLIAKFAGLGDLRKQGSGNIGATNVVRVGGKKLGLIVLLLDAAKGVAAISFVNQIGKPEYSEIAGLVAVIGHVFPIWLKFKGGKGVATTLAALLTLNPAVGLFSIAIWLTTFLFTKLSSLSAIVSIGLSPILSFALGSTTLLFTNIILSAIVIFRHHSNIKRLLSGEEKRIKKDASTSKKRK